MGPLDYTSAFQGVGSSYDAAMGGFKDGVGIKANQIAQQQAQAALAQQKQMKLEINELAKAPTVSGINSLMVKYPSLAEPYKKVADSLAPEELRGRIESAMPVFMALHNNKPDIAASNLREQAKAYRNSGKEQEARAAESKAKMIEENPAAAAINLGGMLSATIGADKFAKMLGDMGDESRAAELQPTAVLKAKADASKAQADATKAGADAVVATATIPEQIAKPGSDLATAEQKRRLDEFDAQIKGADSETKRGQLTLEREKFVLESGLKQQNVGQESQAQIDSAQIALDNIKSLRNAPLMKDTTGNSIAGVGTVIGKMLGNIPGTENKDFRGQLESLKSQIFLPAVQQVKGMGALSNAEGEKLTASVAALDADMSPAAFKNALGVVEKYMTKGLQKGLAAKNVPTQGGGFVVNHPKFGQVNEGDINRLMKQNPGATRDQVMQYLQTTGAK